MTVHERQSRQGKYRKRGAEGAGAGIEETGFTEQLKTGWVGLAKEERLDQYHEKRMVLYQIVRILLSVSLH